MRGRRRLDYMALYPPCIVTRISGSCRSSSETAAAMEYRAGVTARFCRRSPIGLQLGREERVCDDRISRRPIDESAPCPSDSLTRWVDD